MSVLTFGGGGEAGQAYGGRHWQEPVRLRFVKPPDASLEWDSIKIVEKTVLRSGTGWEEVRSGFGPDTRQFRSLCARRRIAPGLIIPYSGVVSGTPGPDRAYQHELGRGWAVDASPELCEPGVCIAGYVNEATEGTSELYNCKFYNLTEENQRNCPAYPGFDKTINANQWPVFLVVMCEIQAGQPLLVSYDSPRYLRADYRAKPDDFTTHDFGWDATVKQINATSRTSYPVDGQALQRVPLAEINSDVAPSRKPEVVSRAKPAAAVRAAPPSAPRASDTVYPNCEWFPLEVAKNTRWTDAQVAALNEAARTVTVPYLDKSVTPPIVRQGPDWTAIKLLVREGQFSELRIKMPRSLEAQRRSRVFTKKYSTLHPDEARKWADGNPERVYAR
jgi:hypothetical protein